MLVCPEAIGCGAVCEVNEHFRSAELEALTKQSLAVSVMDALTSNICVVDPAGKILAVNRAWLEFSSTNSGAGESAYLGTNYLRVCRHSSGPESKEAAAFHRGMQDVLEGREDLFQLEYPCHSPSELRWFLARVTPLSIGSGTAGARKVGAVVSHMKITDRKLLELKYARLASTDPLTGLPNRRFFEDNARVELEHLRRFGGTMSLLMLDLDRFKLVNDLLSTPRTMRCSRGLLPAAGTCSGKTTSLRGSVRSLLHCSWGRMRPAPSYWRTGSVRTSLV